jgi:hypothetical protein
MMRRMAGMPGLEGDGSDAMMGGMAGSPAGLPGSSRKKKKKKKRRR